MRILDFVLFLIKVSWSEMKICSMFDILFWFLYSFSGEMSQKCTLKSSKLKYSLSVVQLFNFDVYTFYWNKISRKNNFWNIIVF